jgi:hypothetical protein
MQRKRDSASRAVATGQLQRRICGAAKQHSNAVTELCVAGGHWPARLSREAATARLRVAAQCHGALHSMSGC